MGVYIPNMEKPEHCYECLLRQGNCCLLLYEAIPPTIPLTRLNDCPLIDIVTCGECIHHDEDGWGYGNCQRRSVDYLRTADEDFCPYGERRE